MKKELYKLGDNFSETLQKVGHQLKNDFLSGGPDNTERDNSILISKTENPSGDNFEFTENSIQISSMAQVELYDSTFCNNKITASNLKKINANSSEIINTIFTGISFKNINLKNNSNIINSDISMSAWSDTSFDGFKISNSKLRGIVFDLCSFENSTFKDLNMVDIIFENVQIINLDISNIDISHLHLKNEIIDSEEKLWQLMNKS